MPETSSTLAVQILDFLTTFVPYAAVVTIIFKVCDSIIKYMSDGRDARTKALIHEVTEPMNGNIKKLTESIWELSRKIEDKK